MVCEKGRFRLARERHRHVLGRAPHDRRGKLLQLNLPPVPDRRLAVRTTPDALRQIRGGHPWLYADSITSVSDEHSPAGSLAVVFDAKRRFVAIGLWDPNSPIRVRILHVGRPRPIDAGFWFDVVSNAAALRSELPGSGTTGFRVLNGENDGTGGLVADRYDDTVVVKVYSPAWIPHLDAVLDALEDVIRPERVVLRLGRNMTAAAATMQAGLRDGVTVRGDSPPGPVQYRENGLTFLADVVHGQKTGSFLDQRDNRRRVRDLARGHRVLDVFSGTGGFSVHAAAGGATIVHAVDQSPHAIAAAEKNMYLNAPVTASTDFRTTGGDAFEVMQELHDRGERYGVVIVDPPAFATSASTVERARRAYRRLSQLALGLIEPGGLLVQASCSARVGEADLVDVVTGAARTGGRRLAELDVTGHGVDHPVTFREGHYLKAVFATVV